MKKQKPDSPAVVQPTDFTKLLEENRKYMESLTDKIKVFSFSKSLPQIEIVWPDTNLSKSLIDSAKAIETDDVLKNYRKLNGSLDGLISSFEIIKSIDWPKPIDIEPFDLKPIDVESINFDSVIKSAAEAKEALTPEIPDESLTERKAETAVGKLVDFASQYGEVIELSVQTILTAKTSTGQEITVRNSVTRKEGFASIDLNQVLSEGQPLALPPPEPAHELLELGAYARGFVKEVDLTARTITFKRKSCQTLHFNDRKIVRDVLKLTLGPEADKKTGWVKLPDELRKWKDEFRVPVKLPRGNQVADPHHDMTKLRHHIDTDAKSGRPKGNRTKITSIRFCRELLPSYKEVLAVYNRYK